METAYAVDLDQISSTTYVCPVRSELCGWRVTLHGRHHDDQVRGALAVHLSVHARESSGCPQYLDRVHILDRGDWYITKDREVKHVSELSDKQISNAMEMLTRKTRQGILSSYMPWWLKDASPAEVTTYVTETINEPSDELRTTPTWRSLCGEATKRGLSVPGC